MTVTALAAAWFIFGSSNLDRVRPVTGAVGEARTAEPPPVAPASMGVDNVRDAIQPVAAASPAGVPLRVVMAAIGRCWVAAEADSARVIYRLMEPGERVVLEGQRTISLRLGDAGAMTLSINGGAGRSIGGDGEVVELEITPDTVKGLAAAALESTSGN